MKRVLIFGGTHGNEWTGITAVTKYAETLKRKHPRLDLHFILANPEAYKINKRFKDEDLNRAFQFLSEERPHSFEHQRARELKLLIDQAPCFVIDLHTTTSNMGPTLIVVHETKLNMHLSHRLNTTLPDCRVILSPDPGRKYLVGQSNEGLMIEVGPVANGVLEAKALESTLTLLDQLLIELSNLPKDLSGEVEIFEEIEDIHYPTDQEGNIAAYIHSSLQNRDFTSLHGEFPAFVTFMGETLKVRTKEELFPIFINEAAYYPVKLAFTLCRKSKRRY
jgi:succinylglutamate desuccinylase